MKLFLKSKICFLYAKSFFFFYNSRVKRGLDIHMFILSMALNYSINSLNKWQIVCRDAYNKDIRTSVQTLHPSINRTACFRNSEINADFTENSPASTVSSGLPNDRCPFGVTNQHA